MVIKRNPFTDNIISGNRNVAILPHITTGIL